MRLPFSGKLRSLRFWREGPEISPAFSPEAAGIIKEQLQHLPPEVRRAMNRIYPEDQPAGGAGAYNTAGDVALDPIALTNPQAARDIIGHEFMHADQDRRSWRPNPFAGYKDPSQGFGEYVSQPLEVEARAAGWVAQHDPQLPFDRIALARALGSSPDCEVGPTGTTINMVDSAINPPWKEKPEPRTWEENTAPPRNQLSLGFREDPRVDPELVRKWELENLDGISLPPSNLRVEDVLSPDPRQRRGFENDLRRNLRRLAGYEGGEFLPTSLMPEEVQVRWGGTGGMAYNDQRPPRTIPSPSSDPRALLVALARKHGDSLGAVLEVINQRGSAIQGRRPRRMA